MIPGEYFIPAGNITCNEGRSTVKIKVVNTADRPVQIGSHCHFFEVNRKMSFDREKAFGMRLNIAAGTAVRFEPGEEKTVELVTIGGARKAFGINNLTNGDTTAEAVKATAIASLESLHFKNQPE
ncbi:urease subunit beta/urease subunit gamma/beta [Chitinophaga jiangningensis]|uniref:Urease subunit beta n=1 Tax=Chitinophaga jiangningensis TaxID=1419482 RepID=A0A1M7K2G4_9BACT|nr:urease subunit beta [Chitinophaga jiangningensis]SHM59512.1 urease subunit beta/urease subunit gamma/beta [Chitinophaga jiangningensis]